LSSSFSRATCRVSFSISSMFSTSGRSSRKWKYPNPPLLCRKSVKTSSAAAS
jgi:hypothetical protein